MAECRKNGVDCPCFYECEEEGLAANGVGWETVAVNGIRVVKARPGTARGKRVMERFAFYCLAKPTGKKIAHKASWTGTTPKWCPLGRGEENNDEK